MSREQLKARRSLDLTGQICPWPVILTLKEIKKMGEGDVLDVVIDHTPSTKNIPEAVKREGHEVLGVDRVDEGVYKVSIRVRR